MDSSSTSSSSRVEMTPVNPPHVQDIKIQTTPQRPTSAEPAPASEEALPPPASAEHAAAASGEAPPPAAADQPALASEETPPPASAEPAAPASGEAPPPAAADQPAPTSEQTPPPASAEPATASVRERRMPRADLLGSRENYNKICVPLHNAAARGDWGAGEAILTGNLKLDLVRSSITQNHDTALHIAAAAKSSRSVERFVANLLHKMSSEDLALQNHSGNTALCVAVAGGNVTIASAMLERNRDLLDIPNGAGMMPLYIASLLGNYNMVNYLYEKSNSMNGESWTREERGWVLFRCVEADFFDVALKIVTRWPELTTNKDVLGVLARKPYAFRGIKPPSLIWRVLRKIEHLYRPTFYARVDHVDAENETDAMRFLRVVWSDIVKLSKVEIDNIIRGPPDEITMDKKLTTFERKEEKAKTFGKEKQEEKANGKEKQEQKATSSISTSLKYSSRVLFVAAEIGNTEFVVELLRLYPDLIWKVNDNKQSIFHVAVLHRQEGIYNLLYEIGSMKDLITPLQDDMGNNMLHLVGKCPPKKRLQDTSGVALQMQRELLWFKEIKAMIPPTYRKKKNKLGLEPHELFIEEHKELASASEKWMKSTASHCMVVAALIATIVFTSAFTIPGGFSQSTGIPMLVHKTTFIAFIVSDAISLTFASISILIFLSILTSRYAEQDFLESLPKKLMLGLAALFFSIVAMMVAFGISFFTLYEKKLIWVPIVICTIAFLPGVLYGRLQYHLLWDIYHSTYGSKNHFKPKKLMLYY